MPVATTQQRPRTLQTAQGRDELNLIDFPIATLQHQQPVGVDGRRPEELVAVIESFDTDLGRVVPRKLTRRTSSRHGFPTPLEDEVLIALLSITGVKNGFTSPRVHFRNSELFNLMNWPLNGSSTRRLSVALDRLTGLTLKYENSWTTDDGTFQKEFTTGLLESYRFTKQTRGRRKPQAESSWIQWSSEVFTDIQRGNVRQLDTDQFYSLSRPVSRRMYRFLDRQLTGSNHFEMELTAFARHLGLSELSHVGKIKERLTQGLRELESLDGFIAPCDASDRYHKRGPGHWLIRFDRPGSGSRLHPSSPPARVRASNQAASLVRQFYELWTGVPGHTPTRNEITQAQQILDRHGTERTSELLPHVVKRMKQHFPNAYAFGATLNFWPRADTSLTCKQRRSQSVADETARERASEDQQRHRSLQRAEFITAWNRLPPSTQNDILQDVRRKSPQFVKRLIDERKLDDPLVRYACGEEMNRRQQSPSPQ